MAALSSGSFLGLPRSRRIKQGRDFTRARNEGQRVVCGCLILNWVPASAGAAPLRVGVITSRKLGNAVVRGRARRLLREVFRLHQHDLVTPVDVVLVARQSIVGKPYALVEKDYVRAVRQARLLKEAM